VSSASGAAGSSHTEGKAAKGSGERGGSRESFKSAALKLFTESNEGNKGLNLIWTSSLSSFFSVDLILQRNFGILIFCFLICFGQNHSEDAVLENRLMKVVPESYRGLATAFGVRTRPRVVLGSGGALESDAGTASHSQSTSCEMPLNPFVTFVSFCWSLLD
jgi:hypothetical protein